MSAFFDGQHVWLAGNDAPARARHHVVEDLSPQVKQGDFTAIVGPAGGGKRTVMKLTTDLKVATKGRIGIGGQPVTGPLKISGTQGA